jgi:hypothetical protein
MAGAAVVVVVVVVGGIVVVAPPVTVRETVATFDWLVPSEALYWNESVPSNPASGVYMNMPSGARVRDP